VGHLFKDFDPKTGFGLKVVDQGVWTVREVGHNLEALLDTVDVAVYETWRLYETHALAMIGNDMQPSQVVGMIRYEAWRQNLKVRNNGADIKKQAFKTMPQWLIDHMRKSTEQHDQDAILHLWYYVWREHYLGR
jgi:hypothetical protein